MNELKYKLGYKEFTQFRQAIARLQGKLIVSKISYIDKNSNFHKVDISKDNFTCVNLQEIEDRYAFLKNCTEFHIHIELSNRINEINTLVDVLPEINKQLLNPTKKFEINKIIKKDLNAMSLYMANATSIYDVGFSFNINHQYSFANIDDFWKVFLLMDSRKDTPTLNAYYVNLDNNKQDVILYLFTRTLVNKEEKFLLSITFDRDSKNLSINCAYRPFIMYLDLNDGFKSILGAEDVCTALQDKFDQFKANDYQERILEPNCPFLYTKTKNAINTMQIC